MSLPMIHFAVKDLGQAFFFDLGVRDAQNKLWIIRISTFQVASFCCLPTSLCSAHPLTAHTARSKGQDYPHQTTTSSTPPIPSRQRLPSNSLVYNLTLPPLSPIILLNTSSNRPRATEILLLFTVCQSPCQLSSEKDLDDKRGSWERHRGRGYGDQRDESRVGFVWKGRGL